MGTAALAATGSLWALATARFFVPNVTSEPAKRFRIGVPADFPPESVSTRFAEQHGVWIVHARYRGQMQIYALRTVCTHLGCITTWQESERRFRCPCHGSGFTVEGLQVEGPAPRPLERHAIRLTEDGQLEVDRSQTFREELGQWNAPASYFVAAWNGPARFTEEAFYGERNSGRSR